MSKKNISDYIPEHIFQPCDCIIVHGEGIISGAIEWFTGGPASHVALYIGGGDRSIIEACAGGIEKNPISHLFGSAKRITVRRYPNLKVKEAEAIKAKAYTLLNNNYDYRLLFSSAVYFLFAKIGIKWKALLVNDRKKQHCSELFAICYKAVRITFAKRTKMVTPKTLLETKKLKTILEVEI